MGNTPSNQVSPARGNTQGKGTQTSQSPPPQHLASTLAPASSSNKPNLRLPIPPKPIQISPNSSHPTSPSGGVGGSAAGSGGARGTSPRRRKSLELPDLNRLAFTPAAPVPTIATHTSHAVAPTTPAALGHFKRGSTGSSVPSSVPDEGSPSRRWRMTLGGRGKGGPSAGLSAMTKVDISQSVPAPRTAPINMPSTAAAADANPYFPNSPPLAEAPKAVSLAASPESRGRTRMAAPIAIPGRKPAMSQSPPIEGTPLTGTMPPPPTVAPSPPPPLRAAGSEMPITEEEGSGEGLVSVPVRWEGGGKSVYVTSDFADNWKKRIKMNKV